MYYSSTICWLHIHHNKYNVGWVNAESRQHNMKYIYLIFMIIKAWFTLYWTTLERSDFYTRLGCCLHCATVIRYVPEQCKQSNPVCSGSKSASTCMFQKQYCILYDIIMFHVSRLSCLLTLLTISDKYINKSDCRFRKHNLR